MRAAFIVATVLSLAATAPKIAQADPLEELVQAENKVYDAWQNLPLTQRRVLFEQEKSLGYGIFKERDGNTFKPGEKLITYVEPIGYGWKNLPDHMFETNFVVDLTIKTDKGDVLADQKGFLKNVLQSHNAAMEFSMDFSLSLTGTPPGAYVVTYTIHDVNSGQDSSFDQDFVIAE
jgi:hypothetical protein